MGIQIGAGAPAENVSSKFATVAAYFAKFKAPPFMLYNLHKNPIPGGPPTPPEGHFLFADSDKVDVGALVTIGHSSELQDLKDRLASGKSVLRQGPRPEGMDICQDLDFGLTMANPTVALQFLEGSFRFGNPGAIDVDAGELFGYVREKPDETGKPGSTTAQQWLTLPQPVESVVLAPIENKPGRYYCTPKLHPNTPLGVQITSGVPGSPIYELAGLYYPFGRNVWWKEVGTI